MSFWVNSWLIPLRWIDILSKTEIFYCILSVSIFIKWSFVFKSWFSFYQWSGFLSRIFLYLSKVSSILSFVQEFLFCSILLVYAFYHRYRQAYLEGCHNILYGIEFHRGKFNLASTLEYPSLRLQSFLYVFSNFQYTSEASLTFGYYSNYLRSLNISLLSESMLTDF